MQAHLRATPPPVRPLAPHVQAALRAPAAPRTPAPPIPATQPPRAALAKPAPLPPRPVTGGGRAVVQRSRYVSIAQERPTILTSQRKATITSRGLGVRVNQGTTLGHGNVYVLNCFPSGSSDSDWEDHFHRTMSTIADAATLSDPSRERRIMLLDNCEETVFWGQYVGRGTVNVTNNVLAQTGLYGGNTAEDVERWVLREIDQRAPRAPIVVDASSDEPEAPQPGCWAAFTGLLSSCWSSCRSKCSSSSSQEESDDEPDLS